MAIGARYHHASLLRAVGTPICVLLRRPWLLAAPLLFAASILFLQSLSNSIDELLPIESEPERAMVRTMLTLLPWLLQLVVFPLLLLSAAVPAKLVANNQRTSLGNVLREMSAASPGVVAVFIATLWSWIPVVVLASSVLMAAHSTSDIWRVNDERLLAALVVSFSVLAWCSMRGVQLVLAPLITAVSGYPSSQAVAAAGFVMRERLGSLLLLAVGAGAGAVVLYPLLAMPLAALRDDLQLASLCAAGALIMWLFSCAATVISFAGVNLMNSQHIEKLKRSLPAVDEAPKLDPASPARAPALVVPLRVVRPTGGLTREERDEMLRQVS